MKTLQMLTLLSGLFLSATVLPAQPRVLIIRHSEKLSGWPHGEFNSFQPLSPAGVATSHALSGWLHARSIRVDTVLSSATTRTLHTAFIIAQAQNAGLGVNRALQDTSLIDAFWKQVKQDFGQDQTVLLVSHSNIIPYLLLKAGLPDSCRTEAGISQPRPDFWLLIEGYDSVWEIPARQPAPGACAGVRRYFFRQPARE